VEPRLTTFVNTGGRSFDPVEARFDRYWSRLSVARLERNRDYLVLVGSYQVDFRVWPILSPDSVGAERVIPSRGYLSAVLFEDVNGDGIDDLVAGRAVYGDLMIWPGLGDGTFNRLEPFSAGVYASGIAVRDLDNDGRKDLLITENANSFRYALGTADGSFEVSAPTGVGDYAGPPAAGDLDRDGDPDIVVPHSAHFPALTVLRNERNGGILPPPPMQEQPRFRVLPPQPNPFRSVVTFEAEIPASGPVEIMIYDVLGRLVYRRGPFHRAAGTFAHAWSGEDIEGRPAPAGVYLIEIRTPDHRASERVVKLP
jgi:hypothetical protein